MSEKSNNQGRAFEYACIVSLHKKTIKVNESSEIEYNSAYEAAKRAWNSIPNGIQEKMKLAADSATETIFELEPCIVDKDLGKISFKLQSDQNGKDGDVRDIILTQEKSKWEIGLSIKNNHFAVKHSRLSRSIDFGDKWYGMPCSKDYWDKVLPIFANLAELKDQMVKWSKVNEKDRIVYRPILEAFLSEVLKAYQQDSTMVSRLIEYLIGVYDYYKVISVEKDKETIVRSYNIKGTLNKASSISKPKIVIPKVKLPKRIVYFDFKPKSNNTLELFLDEGWQLSFRIHNASSNVEPSLKFDIQFVGEPTSVSVIRCKWYRIKQ